MALLSRGLTSAEIAECLHTSLHTTRKHRERIAEKAGLKGKGQDALLLYAIAMHDVLEPFVQAMSLPK